MPVSVPVALRMAVVAIASFAVAFGCAVAVVRIAIRTRFFSAHERLPDTWHGRRIRKADRERREGLNPFLLAFVTFWIAFALVNVALRRVTARVASATLAASIGVAAPTTTVTEDLALAYAASI